MDSKPVGMSGVSSHVAGRAGEVDNKGAQKVTGRPVKKDPTHNDYAVNLSSQAKDLATARAKAQKIASETSPIRADRVAEIKAKIASGEYEINSGKIADGMLSEAIRERLSEMPEE